MADVQGCHLLGSVPLADAETVFRLCIAGLPGRLKRIPDGETGKRSLFTTFQAEVFAAYPPLMTQFVFNSAIDTHSFAKEQVDESIDMLRNAGIETGYDTAAIESYAVFCKLRDEGLIPPGVRFQVCLPTFPNVILPFVQRAFLQQVEPIYEEALFRAMRRIQDAIPHYDLSIQIDISVDNAFWEAAVRGKVPDTGLEWFVPWWDGDVKQYMVDYIVRMMSQVDQDVELGMHNCYGDMNHRHWYEPPSLAVLVERLARVMEVSPHPLNYFHCPVPKSAVENLDDYLAPLKDIKHLAYQQDTEVILGLVHEGCPEMTKTMIQVASKVVPVFTAAMECGGGRMSTEDFLDAMRIARDVSKPVA